MWRAASLAAGVMLMTGVASAQMPLEEEPPEGVDYLMAIQCAALTMALADVTRGSPYAMKAWEGHPYVMWARWRAREAGAAGADALRDIETSRRELVALAGDGDGGARRFRLMEAHRGEAAACEAIIKNAYVTITLGG